MKQFRCFKTSVLLLLLLVVAGACSKFRRIERSEDWRVKYEAGLEYYEKKDYYHTGILFEQIRPIVRGLPEGEKVEFYLAYCQYYERNYILAADQFQLFYETYGRSSMAEEAIFMQAFSMYASAPAANLDQSSSIEAMSAMQNFINRFPNSKFVDRAVEVITESQRKLEEKGYQNALQYLKLRYYKAAIIAFDDFKAAFPDSKYLEEIAFLKVQAQYELARVSIPSKQLERYTETLTLYQELVDNYPSSSFLKQAEQYYRDSQAKIAKLKNNNS